MGAPGVHVAGEVLGQEGGQEGREQVIDALHIPAGWVPAHTHNCCFSYFSVQPHRRYVQNATLRSAKLTQGV